ncbi:MAG: RNA methyltransferase [Candidatus Shikimatogenerans bostrichidophilus]|nr:MAG: RNA methyltransferase [Candidatus Shikimatogenerans bostrichidophilus]
MIKKKYLIIYGYQPIKECLKSYNVKVFKLYLTKIKYNKYKNLINLCYKKKIDIIILKKNNKIKQGIYAKIMFIENININKIIKLPNLLILILYNITDIKNIGSIIRTSVCFNVNLIIISKNLNIFNPNVIKISSGAIFKIPILKIKNFIQFINFLIKKKIKIISVTEKGDKNIKDYNNFNNSIALILGNEETGIPNNILKISNYKLFIPINKRKMSSLNVSIACSIILYELNKIKNYI